MKNVIISATVFMIFLGMSCNGQQTQNKSASAVASNDAPVEVIYFHTTSRCVTCKTVEAEAKKNVDLLYGEQIKTSKISFRTANVEEPEGKALAERVGVAGQSLMIVKGDYKENLITDGFLYAVSQPEKFREIMKTKIDPLLK
jgi:hypothetical protein